MISFLSGQVIDNEEGVLTLLCRGVGYEVTCSTNTLGDLEGRKIVQMWIYTHVREDQLNLFGFSSKVERKLFLSLIKVNGIGPKLAIQVLSGASLDHIIDAIEGKDVKALTALPRVGKKTAEQMILTLKGALVVDKSEAPQSVEPVRPHKEILSALTNLGFRSVEIEEVVYGLPKDIDFEQGVRESLRLLSR
jgi:Holliday junction DNA helicase RuvA